MSPGTPQAGVVDTESSRLAAFGLSLRLEDIPKDVVDMAKEHLLDTLGIAMASSDFEFGRIALAGVRELGDGGHATAIGSGARLPAASAALVNGILAHGLDFDDTHIGGIYHASAPALAAALASGEAGGASGEEVLLAFIAGMEIGCRLAIAGAGAFTKRSFHATAVCGTFAAAIVAGRLSALSPSSVVNAVGLCGSMASGILETGASWLKRMHPGWSAHSAIVATALGRAGFIGPNTVFEGSRGFYIAHLGRVPEGESLPSYGLGDSWQSRGIALKPYPCCHVIHALVDAALEFHDRTGVNEIERIDCKLTREWLPIVAEPREACIRPANPYRALFSVQYVVALALVRGSVDLASFYDEPLDAPDVLALAERTWCEDDPLSDYPAHFPGEMVVTLRNGTVLTTRKAASLGTQEVPMTRTALDDKFLSNSTRVVSSDAAKRLADRVRALEKETNLDGIMHLATASR